MNQTHNITHRLVGCTLLFGLFLESCSGFQNQLAPQEKNQPSNTIELLDNPLVKKIKKL